MIIFITGVMVSLAILLGASWICNSIEIPR